MADRERIYAAIAAEREARADLAAYLRNVHGRRIERDDDHEALLREAVEAAKQRVDSAVEGFGVAA